MLSDHPLVDPARIGMVGLSYGGTVTLFTAAYDERVAAAVVSGYFSSWKESHKMPWNMCGSQIVHGMLGRLEHEDLGALIAPRPLMIESGTEDYLFPWATAAESVRRTRLVYDQEGAGDRLAHDIFEGGAPVARRGIHRVPQPLAGPHSGPVGASSQLSDVLDVARSLRTVRSRCRKTTTMTTTATAPKT